MAQIEAPTPGERMVVIDAAWLRAETADAVRTFVAPFVAAAQAIERVSRPRPDPAARDVESTREG